MPNPNPTRTALLSLKLTGFRNYASLSLVLDGRSLVLTGPNGAGKTNLLEAISFLSPGRGLRRAQFDEVARRPGDGSWAVAATIENSSGAVDLGTGVALGPEGPETRRSVRVNHAPARSADALLEHLRVIWLTPAMDGLFTGPASERRRFLDRAVFAIDKSHGTRVNAFEKAMRGRNKLLAEPRHDARWLDAIEAEMAELAVAIAAARREWASQIAALIASGDNSVSAASGGGSSPFPFAEIALEGSLEHWLDGHTASATEDLYRADLEGERPRDAHSGRTLLGPHLSDLRVRHGPKQAAAETCSTGEQKALLIGLVLAEVRLATQLTGETPLVLLDEIAAHLDEARRNALFAILDDLGCQAFLTGTDAAVFAALGEGVEQLGVREGAVAKAGETAADPSA
ncbi:MAG: DNA replication/repair protein RecF [Bauldia sp.]|nr:DNA replication/repair protein RecF [Bauldia sp.]